ncbi:MAG TPA: hypothetical protein VN132_12870, partial [Bdellovibrio sp.]|nr:hypothetical protein [Bdellovibrio sp.]
MRWIILLISFYSLITFAATNPSTTNPKSPTSQQIWPRDFSLNSKQKITVFQPQVESLRQDLLTAISAFKLTEGKKELFGSFKMSAKALVNKESGMVALSEVKISDLLVPAAKMDLTNLQNEIQKLFLGKEQQVSYQSIRKNLDVQVSEGARIPPEIKNMVPNFIYITKPGILVMLSGNPVWGDSKGASEVKRVMNTSALILHEDNKEYFIWALGGWFAAAQLAGPYRAAKEPSSKYILIKDGLVKEKKIDPMSGKTADGKAIYPPGIIPEIFIATKPSELLQSVGDAKYSAVSGTSLLYMSNSPNSIFLDSKTQDYFVLVTGRWFTTKNLQKGPWSYISGKELPNDFAKIPVTSPVADALVSVPGSPQAKEAQIVSNIPQMAKVPKDLKPKNIECDGKIKWADISGSALKYAENCNTPLIQVAEKQYYAVQDGVWFVSEQPEGPWTVAVAVPNDIYKIPSSCPLYYVTYVHVYGVEGNYVTVGYTPGYHGTFVSADGTIVYGTGYIYPYYVSGTEWYPAPTTYGFGAGYGWGYDDGYYMGFSMGIAMAPWGWGSCCWGSVYLNIDVTNIYHNWGKTTIVTGPGGGGFNVNT